MYNNELDRGIVAAFDAEHRELNHLVQETRQFVIHMPFSGETAEQSRHVLSRLRAHLEHHFAQEEQGGYLEEALVHAPRYSSHASRLLAQHPVMLGRVSDVLTLAGSGDFTEARWPKVQQEVSKLLKELLAHEAGENQLVQRAFNTGVFPD
jgi:hemerythrin